MLHFFSQNTVLPKDWDQFHMSKFIFEDCLLEAEKIYSDNFLFPLLASFPLITNERIQGN